MQPRLDRLARRWHADGFFILSKTSVRKNITTLSTVEIESAEIADDQVVEAVAEPDEVAADQAEVILYSDGACSPNPGLGGWGVVLLAPARGLRKELSGAEAETTNNRMELTAALEGLRALKRPSRVRILTDSEYLQKAFTAGWIEKWRRNGWKTAARQPVKNDDLWQALIEAMKPHRVEWLWVRGHHESEENNRCDELAVDARRRLKKKLDAK